MWADIDFSVLVTTATTLATAAIPAVLSIVGIKFGINFLKGLF